MGLRSVSASEDVIGDPSCLGTNNSALLEPTREKVLGQRASFYFNRAGKKITVPYSGKKCVFRPERNVGKVEQERSAIGRLMNSRWSVQQK